MIQWTEREGITEGSGHLTEDIRTERFVGVDGSLDELEQIHSTAVLLHDHLVEEVALMEVQQLHQNHQ